MARSLDHKLTDRQLVFVAEYLVDYNGARAAKAAGYKRPSHAAARLLKTPHVKAAIQEQVRRDNRQRELTHEEILTQLYYLVTRDVGEMVDDEGAVLPVPLMSERARAVIDGLDQVVTIDLERGEKKVRTRLRLSPKLGAVDLAMKHKGLLAPERHQIEATAKDGIDWDALATPPTETNPVEQELLAQEPPNETEGNSNA